MFFRKGSLKQGLRGVSEGNVIIGYGMWLAEEGIGITAEFVTAPGQEFIVGVATNVDVTSSHDVALEFSFTSNFTDIVGTGTPVGGSLTAAITAAAGDAGAVLLYLREVGGSAARATLACTVVLPFHLAFAAAVQDGTIQLGYYAGVNATVAGGVCSALGPWVGGTVADVLVPPGVPQRPIYTVADAKLLGLPSLSTTGTQWMRSTTPASAVVQGQPATGIVIGVPPTASNKYWWAGATANTDPSVYYYGTPATSYMYAGSNLTTGLVADATQGQIVYSLFNGASSTYERRKFDGSSGSASGNAGANSFKGLTMLAAWDGGLISASSITLWACVTGLSAADKARILVLLQSLGAT